MNKYDKLLVLDALDLKLASIKRAINTNRNPKFRELFEQEYTEVSQLRQKIVMLEEDDLVKPPKK